MSVFVHAQGIKTVHAGGGVKKWQNSVHVVVECPLTTSNQVTTILLNMLELYFWSHLMRKTKVSYF